MEIEKGKHASDTETHIIFIIFLDQIYWCSCIQVPLYLRKRVVSRSKNTSWFSKKKDKHKLCWRIVVENSDWTEIFF